MVDREAEGTPFGAARRNAQGRWEGFREGSVSHVRGFAIPVWHALLPRDESLRGTGFKRYAHSAGHVPWRRDYRFALC